MRYSMICRLNCIVRHGLIENFSNPVKVFFKYTRQKKKIQTQKACHLRWKHYFIFSAKLFHVMSIEQ